jgi:hypothetical protein
VYIYVRVCIYIHTDKNKVRHWNKKKRKMLRLVWLVCASVVNGQQAVERLTMYGEMTRHEIDAVYGGVRTVCEYYGVSEGGRGYDVDVYVERLGYGRVLGTAEKTGNWSGTVRLYMERMAGRYALLKVVMVHELVHLFTMGVEHSWIEGDVMYGEVGADVQLGGESMRVAVDLNANWTWEGTDTRAEEDGTYGRAWMFLVVLASCFVYMLVMEYCWRTREQYERQVDFIDINKL